MMLGNNIICKDKKNINFESICSGKNSLTYFLTKKLIKKNIMCINNKYESKRKIMNINI